MGKGIAGFAVVAAVLLMLPAMSASASPQVFKGVTTDSEGNVLGEGRVVKTDSKLIAQFEIIDPFAAVIQIVSDEPVVVKESWTVQAERIGDVWVQLYPFGGYWEGMAMALK
ncbi:MAG: hypothetical protein AB1485_00280 [Candidatus Thermoplasmatota archaeon]